MTAVRGRLLVTSVAAIAVGLIAPSLGSGSVFIARDARKPTLKIASNGAAEVGWTSKSGARESVVVPMRGRVMPGTKIDGKNVARKTSRWEAAVQANSEEGTETLLLRTPDLGAEAGRQARAPAVAVEGRTDATNARGHTHRSKRVGQRSCGVPQESGIRVVTHASWAKP